MPFVRVPDRTQAGVVEGGVPLTRHAGADDIEVTPNLRSGDLPGEMNLTDGRAALEVDLESELVIVQQDRSRIQHRAGKHLVTGVDELPVDEIELGKWMVEQASHEITRELDRIGASLNHPGRSRLARMNDGGREVVGPAAGDGILARRGVKGDRGDQCE